MTNHGRPLSPRFLKEPLVKRSLSSRRLCVQGPAGHEEAAESLGTTEGPSQPCEDVRASRGATEGSRGGQRRGRAQEMGQQGREPLPSPPLSAARRLRRPTISAPPHGHSCTPGLLRGRPGLSESGSWVGQASLHTEARTRPEASEPPSQGTAHSTADSDQEQSLETGAGQGSPLPAGGVYEEPGSMRREAGGKIPIL